MFSESILQEINIILDNVKNYCIWDSSSSQIDVRHLITDKESLDYLISNIREIEHAINAYDFYLFSSDDCYELIDRIKIKNNILDGDEINNIFILFKNLRRFNSFFIKKDEFSVLKDICHTIPVDFIMEFDQKFGKFFNKENKFDLEKVPVIKKLSRDIFRTREGIINKIGKLLSHEPDTFSDNFHRFINGRYLLPYKKVNKKNVIVQEMSDSGNTFFAEPFWLVEMNNELKRLNIERDQEIKKILCEISDNLNLNYLSVEQCRKSFIHIDSLLARARYKVEKSCIFPEIKKNIKLYRLKNPLIDKKVVVPIDIDFPEDKLLFLVSGPNAGGKTVLIKSIFYSIIMTQLGIALYCDPGSSICLFDNIYDVFGDESSILNSMSTFSSHVYKLARAVNQAKKNSIVFVDEIVSGTDPDEGGVLAKAIIENLMENGIKVVVSTHLNFLKNCFYKNQDAMCVSMGFDTIDLKPKYEIYYHSVNSSYALEIAEKNGLPHFIIQNARSYMDEKTLKLNDFIKEVEKERDLYSRLKKENTDLKKVLKEKEEILEEKIESYEKDKKKKIENELKRLKNEFEEYRRIAIEKLENVKSRKDVDKFYEITSVVEEKSNSTNNMELIPVKFKELKTGQTVFVKSLRVTGKILSIESEKNIRLDVGGKSINIGLKDLFLNQNKKSYLGKKKKNTRKKVTYSENIERLDRIELNILGLTVDEALYEVKKFLEKSYMFEMETVRVVHGKGRIREAVLEYFDRNSKVKKHEFAGYFNGGSGVSVVFFNKS